MLFNTKNYFIPTHIFFVLLIFCSKITLGNEVHCVFIHGAGTIPIPNANKIYNNINLLPPDLIQYWGDVRLWTAIENESGRPPCTSYAFTYLDTVNNPWHDESLADAACIALKKSEEPFTQRIFLHSMGNLIFYNALHSNKCAINPDNTNVYSFGGPFLGSSLLPVAEDICITHKACELAKEIPVANMIVQAADVFLKSRSFLYNLASEKVCDYMARPDVQDKFQKNLQY